MAKDTSVKELRTGRLSHSKLELIWTQPLFTKSTFPVLLAVLRKFDILFKLPKKDGEEDQSIIPYLLPFERPDHVKDIWPPFEDDLNFLSRTWDFSFLPLGFFPRLIARTCHLPLVTLECVWRTGMVVMGEGKVRPAAFRILHRC